MISTLNVKLFFLYGIVLCFILSILFGTFVSISTTECKCGESSILPSNQEHSKYSSLMSSSILSSSLSASVQEKITKHKLAILVPFRDRFEELLEFAPHINEFLHKQQAMYPFEFHIFILNQRDRLRFNRASLINVGFLFTREEYDYIAMHDVDLLPLNDNLKYEYPEKGPLHIAAPEYHPKYHYPTFVGGILLIKREHFFNLNGMSNRYWGWGLEDDEFYVRIKQAGLEVSRPKGITTGPENTFKHIHDRQHRKRDTEKCFNQREVTRKRDRETGLNTTKYELLKINKLVIDNVTLTVLNIKLACDRNSTPWCDCSQKR